MDEKIQKIVYLVIGLVVIELILIGLRALIVKTAYDAASGYSVALANGSTLAVPASGMDPGIVPTLLGIAMVVLPIFVIIAIFVIVLKPQ